jgi:hypothetical protein
MIMMSFQVIFGLFCGAVLILQSSVTGNDVVTRCQPFSTYADYREIPSIFCAFQVCGVTTVTVSGCPEDGASCAGDQYFKVFDTSGYNVGYNDDYCGLCSRVSFQHEHDGCSWFNIHQNCWAGSCSGQTQIFNGNFSAAWTQGFALRDLPWGHGIYSFLYEGLAEVFGWDFNTSIMEWSGIGTDGNGNVTSITINRDENIVGYLDCASLLSLPYLQTIHAPYNYIFGSIPECLIYHSHLAEFHLAGNQISGSLPSLPESMVVLSLDDNIMSGSIDSLPSRLRYLSLWDNAISGWLPSLPEGIETINVGKNRFSGPVPNLFRLGPALSTVVLDDNNFSGRIPNLPANISKFSMNNNAMSGELPVFPASLLWFAASNNFVWGTLPKFHDDFRSFVADNNWFTGSLRALAGFSSLEILSLTYNMISGEIPDLPTSLEYLFLGHNSLSGSLPPTFESDEFISNSALVIMNISSNPSLTGVLNSSICSVKQLKAFSALDCSFKCYLPCFPQTAYIDYMTPLANQEQTYYANYDVCISPEVVALCALDEALSITAVVPRSHEYLVQAFEEKLTLKEMDSLAVNAVGTVFSYSYTFQDYSKGFSRFEVVVEPISLVLVDLQIELEVQCGFNETFTQSASYPGIGDIAPVECEYDFLDVRVNFAVNGISGIQQAPTTEFAFTVNRYALHLPWNCTVGATTTSSPCDWFGT